MGPLELDKATGEEPTGSLKQESTVPFGDHGAKETIQGAIQETIQGPPECVMHVEVSRSQNVSSVTRARGGT